MPMSQNLFKNITPARGELWISGELLLELGFEKKQESLINLSLNIGADICFFSYTSPIEPLSVVSDNMSLLVQKAHSLNLSCGVAVDGPFERTVGEYGFIEVMKWFYETEQLKKELEKNAAIAAEELRAAEEAGADMFILCDDIAYARGLYFSPEHYKSLLLPYYQSLRKILKPFKPVGFHSDGNIQPVIGTLIDSGYSVFSLEPEAVPLMELIPALPSNVVILSGIKAGWLMGPGTIDDSLPEINEFIYNIKHRYGRNFIMASSCGVSDMQSLERLKVIYGLLDK